MVLEEKNKKRRQEERGKQRNEREKQEIRAVSN